MQLPTVTLCFTILGISLANAIVINLQDGDIRGLTKTYDSPNGTVSIFYGIPFAKPAVGELRFRKPQPPNPWNGTLDATKKPNSCPQAPPFFSDLPFAKNFEVTTTQSEDCLYLNVWTPAKDVKNLKISGNRDVIFWIHGGGFTVGGSMMNAYDGSYLALKQNVVFVSINYRLGPLGFLYLGNEDAPGNMGLYDILMALDWVKKNIRAFGGNPESITIIGESAGGASVSALLLSPLGKGKFKNAVIQSGTMLSAWSHKSKEDALKIAKTVSETTGCSQINSSSWDKQKQIPSSVIDCLRKLDVKALNAAVYPPSAGSDFEVKIAPTIDGHFFPSPPIQMLKDNINSANVMIGHTAKEMSIFILAKKFLREIDFTSNAISRFIISKNAPNLTELEIEILQISYSDWTVADNTNRNRDSIIDLLGDVTMVCPSVAFASAVSAINKVYYYEFQHVSSSLSKFLPPWVGATHALDVPFFLGTALDKSLAGYNEEDQKVSESIMKHLANFARTGNPSSSADSPWPEFKANEPHVFIFGKSNHTSGSRIPKCTYFNENYPNWLLSSGVLQSAKKDVCSVFNSAISQYYKLETFLISFLFSIIFININ